jgi:hypothetical protein
MKEVGLTDLHLKSLERETGVAKENCISQTPEATAAIQLEDLSLLIYIFTIGFLLSGLIFLYEFRAVLRLKRWKDAKMEI